MKIFISHAREDKAYGNALVDLLTGLGIPHDDIIFTSNDDYGIPVGENIFDWLKAQLKEKPYVFYLLSPNYYDSVACQNEMGAAWIIENKQTMIFTPEFNLEDKKFLNGALDPKKIGVFLDEESKMNKFIDSLKNDFSITTKINLRNRKVRDFLAEIAKIKKATPPKTKEPEQKDNVGLRAGITPKKEVLSEDDKLFYTILADIQKHKNSFKKQSDFDTYIRAKFLDEPDVDLEVKIFTKLWPIVFKSEDKSNKENREIHLTLLTFLFDENKTRCSVLIKDKYKYFNDISSTDDCLRYLIRFLVYNDSLYPVFKDIAGLYITKFVENNFVEKVNAWFLSGSLPNHLQNIQSYIKYMPIAFVDLVSTIPFLNFAISKGYKTGVADFLIEIFNREDFEDAYIYLFSEMVIPFLETLNEEQLYSLCDRLNNNIVEYDMFGGPMDLYDHRLDILFYFPNFDFSKYPKVFKVE